MLNREKQREKSGRRKRHHKTRTLAAVPNDPALYFTHLLSAKQEAVPIFTPSAFAEQDNGSRG